MPKGNPISGDFMKRKANMNQFIAKEPTEFNSITLELKTLKLKLKLEHYEIAELLGINMRTWQKRIAEPETMRLYELRRLHELCRLYGMEVNL